MLFYLGLTCVITVIGIEINSFIENKKTARILFCVFCFLLLGSISAFRYNLGYDYNGVYIPAYNSVIADPFASTDELRYEPGFIFLERLTAVLSRNPQWIFVVTGYTTIGLLALFYFIYSPNPVVSIFLFLSLGQFYTSMNSIRQMLAAVICLYAIPFLQARRFGLYGAVILLAVMFHTSAVIMIPFYFINLIPLNWYALIVYLPMSAILYFSSDELIELVTGYIYSRYSAGSPEVATGLPAGIFIAMLLSFVFLFIFRKSLAWKSDKRYVYLNYAFFSMFFMFLGTEHAILGRFAIYFSITLPVGGAMVLAGLRQNRPGRRELHNAAGKRILQMSLQRRLNAYRAGLIAIFLIGTLIHLYVLAYDFNGVVPYKSVFDNVSEIGNARNE